MKIALKMSHNKDGRQPEVAPNLGARSKQTYNDDQQLETPIGLRNILARSGDRSFSGFAPERNNMRKIIELERDMRALKDLVSDIFMQQEQLMKENEVLQKENKERRCEAKNLRKERSDLKAECENMKATVTVFSDDLTSVSEQVNDVA